MILWRMKYLPQVRVSSYLDFIHFLSEPKEKIVVSLIKQAKFATLKDFFPSKTTQKGSKRKESTSGSEQIEQIVYKKPKYN